MSEPQFVPPEMPHEVRTAIRILLNHVEPGWDNCRALVGAWLNGCYLGIKEESQDENSRR